MIYKKFVGTVIPGKKLGRELSFPTANIAIVDGELGEGTYKINVQIRGQIYRGVGTYIAKNHIFEAHIFDFDEDIYGEEIAVYVLYKIRENKQFDLLQALVKQISKDVAFCKITSDIILTFGTFDIFHEGHKDFLLQAKCWGDTLVCVVATDENVLKFKGELPQNDENTRFATISASDLVDICVIGKGESPLVRFDIYKPKIVCLGYDQKGFAHLLESYIQAKKIDVNVLRLAPYKENIYKSSLLKKGLKNRKIKGNIS